MEDKKSWYSMHIVLGLLLAALSVYVIAVSVATSQPMLESEQATVLDMPGLSPIVCAALLLLFSVALCVESFKKGGRISYYRTKEFFAALRGAEAVALYKVFVLLLVYVFGLWSIVPFWLSSGLFMVAFMAAFGRFSWKTVLVSAIAAAALWFVFNDLFQVLLPSRFFFDTGVES